MFSGVPVLTETGMTLLLRAAAGETFTLTKFQAGNGMLADGEEQHTVTALKNPILTNIGITRTEGTEDDGYIQVQGAFDNQTGLNQDFRWTELGLIAEDEDGNEYLYAYGYEDEYAELLKAGASATMVEQTFSILIFIGDTQNITAYVMPNATYATKAEFDNHANATGNVHGATPQDIGAAESSHTHSTDDIESGILPVSRGGTGVSNLQELSSLLNANFVFGTFVGDGKSRKDIILGFTPQKVLIVLVNVAGENNQVSNAAYIETKKNLYHSGCGSNYYTASAESMLGRGHGGAGIITNGFAVGYGNGGRSDQNINGRTYVYVAFK